MSIPEYEEGYYRNREVWPDFRLEAATLIRLARLSPDARVLELGCGGGELLLRLSRKARRVAGVDLSPAALRLATQAVGSHGEDAAAVLCARAEELPFAPGSFDAVVAQHLVEHLPDMDGALREWRRVLRPGGTLALVTPNAAYPDPTHFHDPTHVNLLTASALRAALERAGFRPLHLSTLFPFLGRSRPARWASIRLAGLARLPALSHHGRTIVASASVASYQRNVTTPGT